MKMFSSFLLRKLVIPFFVLISICILFVIIFPSNRDIWINLSTTFLGILITVCYVDFVFSDRERKRWAEVMEFAYKRINRFVIVAASQIRSALKISSAVYIMDFKKPASIRRETIRVTENIVLPQVDEGIQKLTQKDWENLNLQFRLIWEYGEEICSIDGNRIGPKILSGIMKIQDEINNILICHSTFPDIIGVADEKLPIKKNGSSKDDRIAIEKIISTYIKNILMSTVEVMRILEKEGNKGTGRDLSLPTVNER